MRIVILIFCLFVFAGCPTSGVSQPDPGHAQESHKEGDGHEHEADESHREEGHLQLTEAQRKQLQIEVKPVVAASGKSTGLRPGRVEADPDRQVVVSSQVSGVLQQLYAHVGSSVRKGSTVAVLASPEVTSLQSEYHQAEVEAELARKELNNKRGLVLVGDEIKRPLETARLELAQAESQLKGIEARLKSAILKNERLETLLKEGIASRQQVDESRADRQSLEAELNQAKAALQIAENHLKRESRISKSGLKVKAQTFPAEARLARASEQMRHSRERLLQLGANPDGHDGLIRLNSPLDGVVVERAETRGSLVSAGQKIALVVDSSEVWVWVDLQREDLKFVQKGDPLELSLVGQPGTIAQGFLDYISPQLDQDTQTFKARVVLADPPAGFNLGSFVNARVSTGGAEMVAAIPQTAVQFVEGQTVVYRQLEQEFQRTPVVLGPPIDQELVSVDGLKVGERIAVTGVEQLKSLDLSDQIGGHHH